MCSMDLYKLYESGFNNTAYQFAYVPELNNADEVKAYSLGSIDGRLGKKKTIDEFLESLN